jgi:NCS1 family nucleobase:cation symporter-1
MLSAGIRIPRFAAAGVDGVIMLVGTIYIVFVSGGFLAQFEGFLITVGVPIAAWCGVFLGDLVQRKQNYVDADLFDNSGRYGDVRLVPIVTTIVASILGWGLVTNSLASWLTWQGYLLAPFGLGGKTGPWAYANLGVLAALVFSFAVTVLSSGQRVREQESTAS